MQTIRTAHSYSHSLAGTLKSYQVLLSDGHTTNILAEDGIDAGYLALDYANLYGCELEDVIPND